MKDSKEKDIELVISPDTAYKLALIRNLKEMKAALAVLSKIKMTTRELTSTINTDGTTFDKIMKNLSVINLVTKMVDKETREVCYVVSRNVTVRMKCLACELHRLDEDGVIHCESPVNCLYNYERFIYGYHILIRKTGQMSKTTSFGIEASKRSNKARSDSEKPIDDWITNDFVDFLYNKYGDYDHILTIRKGNIRRYVVKLKKTFEVEFSERWQYVLKHYIVYTFNKADEKRFSPSLKMMCEKNIIQEFVDDTQFVNYKKCEKHKLYCPYWKDGGCSLKNMKCKKDLRKKLTEKYNK